jgi:hypothetical protein
VLVVEVVEVIINRLVEVHKAVAVDEVEMVVPIWVDLVVEQVVVQLLC